MLPAGILATGDATVRVKPDGAIIVVGAVVQARTASEAQARLSARIATVLERAKALAIAEGDTKTVGYRIDPQYAFEEGRAPRLTGFQATQNITLTIREPAGAAKVLDELMQGDDGANTSSIAFTLLDPKTAQASAREQAIQDAIAKAKAMAKAAGVQLGRVISVSDVGLAPTVGGNVFAAAFSAMADVRGAQPQLPTGELEVLVRVQVQFELAP